MPKWKSELLDLDGYASGAEHVKNMIAGLGAARTKKILRDEVVEQEDSTDFTDPYLMAHHMAYRNALGLD